MAEFATDPLDATPGTAEMILAFTTISIFAAALGLYSLLSIAWKDLKFEERADAILYSGLLSIISVLAFIASYVGEIK